MQSAAEGHGVALARANLAREELERGDLVRVFPALDGVRARFAYYLVTTPSRATVPAVAAFRDWLTRPSCDRLP